ncbi:MAG: tail fiber protein [Desulfobulbaceae bacterium]|nr:tail fiber protein [Desulfobulbaceae bacterium]
MTNQTIQSQFNNIVTTSYAELRNIYLVSDNDFVHLLGGVAANDGDQGQFYWDSANTETDDGVDIIKPTDIVGAGRWLRLGGAASFNLTYENFAAVRVLVPPDFDDGTIYALGQTTRNDGGQGLFYYDTTETAADDDYFILIPDSITFPAAGRWLRVEAPADTLGLLNVAALRAYLGFIDDNTVFILGESTRDDGGQGRFYYDSTATATDDGYDVVKPTAIVGAGRWLRASGGVPAGSSMAWWTATPPAGYLLMTGQALVTTDYPRLFAVLGYTYGGSGLSFNVPQTEGMFLRGTDNGAGNDPDAATRTDRGDGTTGDNVGTNQPWQNEAHTHGIPVNGNSDGNGGQVNTSSDNSVVATKATNSDGGNQANPININTNWIIKT